MARPSNTAERQEQITGALLRVMAKRGYDGASITDIAKAARLTPGLVHYHFASKHEILLAALERLVAQHAAALETHITAVRGDPIAELAAVIDFHLGLGASADPEALACWILLSGEALRDGKVRVEFERAIAGTRDRIAGMIRSGAEQGAFAAFGASVASEPTMRDAIDAAASALVATIQGYFVLAATARSVIPRGSAAAATKKMAEGLLRPTRAFPRSGS